jgi:serine/threonine-protein kinase
MSPEQQAGEWDRVGPASDVFSLGVTLYVILTGKKPFEAGSRGEVARLVAEGTFPPPRMRKPDVSRALEAICLKAMARDSRDRYPDALALASDVDRWLAGDAVSAWREPLTVRLGRWVSHHRTLVMTATAAVLSAVVLAGVVWASTTARQRRLDRDAGAALAEADRYESEAQARSDAAQWGQAIAAVRRAQGLLDSGAGSSPLRLEVDRRIARLLAQERDRRMVRALDEARIMRAGHRGQTQTAASGLAAYRRAFRDYGIDVLGQAAADAADRIRKSPIRETLVAAVDDWAVAAGDNDMEPARLWAVARAADPDPERNRIRAAVERRDGLALKQLVTGSAGGRLPPDMQVVLGRVLVRDSQSAAAVELLGAAQRLHPGDFWINHDLGMAYANIDPPRTEAAVRYYTAAVAIRPDSPGANLNLARALREHHRLDEASVVYRRVIALSADFANAYHGLGRTLKDKGDTDGAIRAYRQAIALDSSLAAFHFDLGNALVSQSRLEEAIAAYKAAVQRDPNSVMVHNNLGEALRKKGDLDGAIAEFRQAIELEPGEPMCTTNLSIALKMKGEYEQAISHLRQVVTRHPDFVEGHINLGFTLMKACRYQEALVELERGHEIGSTRPGWSQPSGRWVADCRKLVALDHRLTAIREGRSSPSGAEERVGLGHLCALKGLNLAAAQFFDEAFASEPRLADDVLAGHRFIAACAAAQAASATARTEPRLSAEDRDHWRSKSMGWLRADLATWSERLASNPTVARNELRNTLTAWQKDARLVSIRDPGQLTKLPDSERDSCRAIWSQVGVLLSTSGKP